MLVVFSRAAYSAEPPPKLPERSYTVMRSRRNPFEPFRLKLIAANPEPGPALLSPLGIGGPANPTSEDQVLNSVFDAVNTALRINATLAGGGSAGPSNAEQIYRAIYDSTNNAIRVNCITGCGGGSGLWSGIGNPTGNLALTMGAFSSTFTHSGGAGMPTNTWSFADTWNQASYAGPWWKVNFTDTSSNAAALLFDWQVGGVSKFKVDKTGAGTFAGKLIADSLVLNGSFLDWTKVANPGNPASGAVRQYADSTSGKTTFLDSGGLIALALGSAVNSQTGTTYTVVTADRGKLVTISNAAAIAVTLPQAGSSFPADWFFFIEDRGAGTATITPTTSTIDGAASLALTQNQGVSIWSDGTNYFTGNRGTGGAGGGLGYEMYFKETNGGNPADSTTYYYGAWTGQTTVAANTKLTVLKACTAKAVEYVFAVGGVSGSTEATTIDLWLNAATAFGSTTITFDTAANSRKVVTGLTQALAVNDTLSVRLQAPAWVTNPTSVTMSARLYCE